MADQGRTVDGVDLAVMLSTGVESVERELPTLNHINVFPVPDADTGTNLVQTVRRANAELERIHDSVRRHVGAVADGFARGAFSGARGNSGVILAEILRGLARALEGTETVDGRRLAMAFHGAAQQAYQSVSKPVEGTMLTVIRDVATEATDLAGRDSGDGTSLSVETVLDRLLVVARESVRRTPELLPVLREHGVVDSGALGLAIFLEGMRRGMGDGAASLPRFAADADARDKAAGEPERTGCAGADDGVASVGPATGGGAGSEPGDALRLGGAVATRSGSDEPGFGFCTEFMIVGASSPVDAVRQQFESLGESVVIAGDADLLRVHLHAPDPGAAISLALRIGKVRDISVRNMDDQVTEAASAPQPAATLAFASGDGFISIFQSLGAVVRAVDEVTEDGLAKLVHAALRTNPAEELIVVPASRRVADEVARFCASTGRVVHVVDALDPPRGVAALMAFTYGAPVHRNLESMNEAARMVEVASAGRDDDIAVVVQSCCSDNGRTFELATVYYGRGVSPTEAKNAAEVVTNTAGLDSCEMVYGGQSDPAFLISFE